MSPDTALRVVIFREGDRCVAQCLELDLAVSHLAQTELLPLLRRRLRAQAALDRRSGREPFGQFRPAPQRYWQLYQAGRPWDASGIAEDQRSLFRRWFARLRRDQVPALRPAVAF